MQPKMLEIILGQNQFSPQAHTNNWQRPRRPRRDEMKLRRDVVKLVEAPSLNNALNGFTIYLLYRRRPTVASTPSEGVLLVI